MARARWERRCGQGIQGWADNGEVREARTTTGEVGVLRHDGDNDGEVWDSGVTDAVGGRGRHGTGAIMRRGCCCG